MIRLRFGTVTVRNGSGGFGSDGSSSGKRVPAVFKYTFRRKNHFWFRFRFVTNGSGGSGPLATPGKAVLMLLVALSSTVSGLSPPSL